MSQPANRAFIRLIGDKEPAVATSVEEGESVVAHLSSGAEHTVEVRRHRNGARVVIRTAAIACVEFLSVEEPSNTPTPADPSRFGRVGYNG